MPRKRAQPISTSPAPTRAASAMLAPGRAVKGLVIRAPSYADAEALAELFNQPGFRHGTLRLPYQSADDVRRFLESRPPANVSLVAVLEGRLVGQGGLTRGTGRRTHVGSIGMGVHDAFVGRGIGRALLAALVDVADDWLALLRLELTVYVDNAPALALYKSFGFEIEGTRRADAFRAGHYVDTYEMARLAPQLQRWLASPEQS